MMTQCPTNSGGALGVFFPIYLIPVFNKANLWKISGEIFALQSQSGKGTQGVESSICYGIGQCTEDRVPAGCHRL